MLNANDKAALLLMIKNCMEDDIRDLFDVLL